MLRPLLRLAKSFLIGVAASFHRSAPTPSAPPPPIVDEWQVLYRSEADYRVRTVGSVRYTYSGPMIRLDQGGILNRTPSWKTVTDRDFRNRCVEGTGVDPEMEFDGNILG